MKARQGCPERVSRDLHRTGEVGGGVGRAQGKPLLRKDTASSSCGIRLRWKNGVEVVEAGGSGLSHLQEQNLCTEKGGHHRVLGGDVNCFVGCHGFRMLRINGI